MNPILQDVDDYINNQAQAIVLLQKQIEDLNAAARVVTISGIQSIQPETLWYEARSRNAPKSGPHGTVAIKPGEPALVDFHPLNIGGSSDNVYCLRRLYLTLSAEQQAILESATQFSVGCDVALDPLSSVQAFELDYQIRKKSGITINMGLQILPSGSSWQLRGFDFVKKGWEPIGGKVTPVAGKSNHISLDAICDDKTVQFVQAVVDGVATPVSFSHPVSMEAANASYINAAYQLDATADGKAYKAAVGHFAVKFS